MKKVAATKGQSVSLGFFVFAAEMTREGKWAGTDMLLNLYRRPPRRISWPALREFLRVRLGRIQGLHPHARKNCLWMNISRSRVVASKLRSLVPIKTGLGMTKAAVNRTSDCQ